MGSSKADSKLHQPGVYRDEPHRDDAASTSSAVLMGDIIDTFPGDEELPAYSDSPTVPLILSHSQGQQDVSQSHPIPITTHSYLAPSLPFSTSSTFCETVWTNFPSYSTEADTLENMIKEQALYPPTYFLQINGTHTETIKRGNKEEKNRITDFFIQIDMTWLLTRTPGKQVGSESHQVLLADDQRGYRGGRLPSRTPNVSDVEEGQALRAWCDKFVSDPAGVKAFTLKREVIRHDTKQLENYIRSLIASTNYRGHVSVDFPMYRKEVVVFSPGKLNEYRTKKWLRWFFYLTFLWIFSWPVLFFLTKKYEVVKAVYPYASDPLEGERRPVVMSEMNFFQLWESSLKRGVLSRFNGVMNDEYRIATRDADARGMLADQAPPRTTGNAFADGAISILSTGLDLTLDYRSARGWGYDC